MADDLTAVECQSRIDQFVEVTNTDEAEAQSVLQDHEWNLEAAINAHLGATVSLSQPGAGEASDVVVSSKPPSILSMITWNIDGLDEKNKEKRIAYVVNEIRKIKPDVVFLQEATDYLVEQLERHLVDYQLIEQGGRTAGYFTCVLLRLTTMYLDEYRTKEFDNTRMGRGVQYVKAHMGKANFCFMNVHLESTKDFGKERTKQLEDCIAEIKEIDKEVTVVMAGDLNARDSEVASINDGQGLPANIFDAWEQLGRRKEVQYTWDCMRNTNLQFSGRFKPRMRFDRVFVRASSDKRATLKSFNLIGLEKVPGTQSFASDHWGILVTFDMNN